MITAKEMTLKKKLKFLDWAIKKYLKAGKKFYNYICIALARRDGFNMTLSPFTYADYTEIRFPELSKEIDRVMKRTGSWMTIGFEYDSYVSLGRAKLLQRVQKKLLK